jgi:hypothetical protein
MDRLRCLRRVRFGEEWPDAWEYVDERPPVAPNTPGTCNTLDSSCDHYIRPQLTRDLQHVATWEHYSLGMGRFCRGYATPSVAYHTGSIEAADHAGCYRY